MLDDVVRLAGEIPRCRSGAAPGSRSADRARAGERARRCGGSNSSPVHASARRRAGSRHHRHVRVRARPKMPRPAAPAAARGGPFGKFSTDSDAAALALRRAAPGTARRVAARTNSTPCAPAKARPPASPRARLRPAARHDAREHQRVEVADVVRHQHHRPARDRPLTAMRSRSGQIAPAAATAERRARSAGRRRRGALARALPRRRCAHREQPAPRAPGCGGALRKYSQATRGAPTVVPAPPAITRRSRASTRSLSREAGVALAAASARCGRCATRCASPGP